MIDAIIGQPSRKTLFCAFNAILAVLIFFLVVQPLWAHFSAQGDDIAERRMQLLHFQAIADKADALMHASAKAIDPFLPGSDERIASADLQASLRSLITSSGTRFLGIRGLESQQFQQTRIVSVRLELEGSLPDIRNFIGTIENQTPFLFVTSAVLRSSPESNELIHAEMTIEGAMR